MNALVIEDPTFEGSNVLYILTCRARATQQFRHVVNGLPKYR